MNNNSTHKGNRISSNGNSTCHHIVLSTHSTFTSPLSISARIGFAISYIIYSLLKGKFAVPGHDPVYRSVSLIPVQPLSFAANINNRYHKNSIIKNNQTKF